MNRHERQISGTSSTDFPMHSQVPGLTEPPSDRRPIFAGEDSHDPCHSSDPLRWRPFWLRRRILAVFLCVFLCLAAVFPILQVYSDKMDGLWGMRSELWYMARFGPTAVFTLLSVFWARVELQTLRYKPWMSMEATRLLTHEEYRLDYTLLIMPSVIRKSFHHRHWMVLLVVMVSIILKVQIVLSTSIFEIVSIEVSSSLQVQARDFFMVDDDNITAVANSQPYLLARAADEYNLGLPFGLSNDCAYQTFWRLPEGKETEDNSRSGLRGTVDAPSSAMVDAVFANMTCLTLEHHESRPSDSQSSFAAEESRKITLRFQGCGKEIELDTVAMRLAAEVDGSLEKGTVFSSIVSKVGRPCESLPQQHQQFIYYAALYNGGYKAQTLQTRTSDIDANDFIIQLPTKGDDEGNEEPINTLPAEGDDEGNEEPINTLPAEGNDDDDTINILPVEGDYDDDDDAPNTSPVQEDEEPLNTLPVQEYAAILCTPTAWVSRVKVIDNGVHPNVTVLPPEEQSRRVIRSNLWDVLVSSIPPGIGVTNGDRTYTRLDHFLEAEYAFRGLTLNHSDPAMYDSGLLLRAVTNLTDKIGPAIAHDTFRMQKNDEPTLATSLTVVERLQMSRGVCIAISALFGPCAIISLAWLLNLRGSFRTRRRDPATVLGTITSFRGISNGGNDGSDGCLEPLSEVMPELKAAWAEKASCQPPVPLRSWLRVLISTAALASIATLITTLRVSQTSQGLASVGEGRYTSFLWTSVPAAAMLLIVLHVGSMDVAIRSMTTLRMLATRPCEASEIDRSYVDMLGLCSLWYGLRRRDGSMIAAQLLVIICSFLTALSSVLFTPELFPRHTAREVMQGSRLGPERSPDDFRVYETVGALLSMSHMHNVTYPADTYEDLLFPSLSLPGEMQQGVPVTMEFAVPATKVSEKCTRARLVAVDFESPRNEVQVGRRNSAVDLTEPVACSDGSLRNSSTMVMGGISDDSFFAHVLWRRGCGGNSTLDMGPGWISRGYVWAKASSLDSLEFQHVSAWRCNYTWSEVPTTVTLTSADGTNFQISPDMPPMPDTSRARPWTVEHQPLPMYDVGGQGIGLDMDGWGLFPDELNPDPRFSAQFQQLMEPTGPITVEDLGRSEKEAFVLETVSRNTRVALAQILNMRNRVLLTEPSATKLPRVNVTMTWAGGSRRLVQNTGVTYSVVAILALVAVVNIWSLISSLIFRRQQQRGYGLWEHEEPPRNSDPWWLLDLEFRGVAPENFSSIAMMAALLDGARYHNGMPVDAGAMKPEDLYEFLVLKRFQTGWLHGIDGQGALAFSLWMMDLGVKGGEEVLRGGYEGSGAESDRGERH